MFIDSAMPVTNAKGMVNIVPFDISVQKLKLIAVKYHNDPKFSDKYVWANNADPDQTELHCLLFILLLLQTFLCCKANLLYFKSDYSKTLGVQNLGLLQYEQTYNVYDIKAKFWCNIYTRNCTSNVANSARNSD